MGGTTTSQRLSPGRWVAVLNHVTHGDANQAPDTWEHTGDLGQTQPVMNQSIEFTVTENSATQTLQFGYGPRDLNLAVVPAPSGPAFNVKSDENYDQVADPGEPFVPDGIEFTLGSVHLADSAVTGSTSGSTVTFPRDNRVGARVMAVTYGHAAPPPESWSTWGYAEGRSRTIRYLIHEDVNDDCDQDPGDDRPAACAHWGPIDAMPTVPILPAATPVAGQVFVDTDGDGVRDPGETAPDLADLQVEFVPAWELEPDNEGNPFEWDAPRADVATDGAFDLGMVPKGSYGIATTAAGWKVTTPPVVVPSTGHSLGPVEVGIARTHVSGRLYVDTDGDQEFDSTERALVGVTLRTMSYAGEASEVLDEAITDGQGRFRIGIDRESARIDVDGPLPDDVESTDSFSLDLPAAGVDLTHDLVLQPAGVPEPIWDSWSRDDTDIRKLWWEESGPGSSPVTGYVIRTWEADEDELSPRKVTEQCVGPGTFATAPLQGDLATVQAVNERGVSALDAWNDDAGPERPDGPTPTIVDCSTLFDGDAVTDPPEPQSPGQPAAVTSGDIASRSATVSWEEGPGGPATAYRVQISHGTDFTDLVQEQVVSAPVTSHRFTALTNGVVHHARVRAENPHGVSVWAVSDPFTPDAAPPAPGRPAVALRPSAAVVTWQPGSVTDEHGAATEFLVRARQGAGTWSTMATVPAGTLRTRVTGLSPRKKYTFVVVARNAVAESNASPGRAVVAQTRPAKPRAVKAVPRKRAVLIRWKPGVLRAQHGTTQRYLVQRKVGAQWRTVKSLPSKARQHRVARLTPGKVIRLRVVARGAVGDTASAVVRAKPRR